MIDAIHTLTFKKFSATLAQETATEYGIAVAEVLDGHINYGWEGWRDAVVDAIKTKGYQPTQAWINATRDQAPEWWERRIVHDNPDWAWTMSRRGLALLTTKTNLWNKT